MTFSDSRPVVPTVRAGNTKSPASMTETGRWGRPVAFGLTVVIGAYVVSSAVGLATSAWGHQWALENGDLNGYLDGARRFLATGSPYAPEQLARWHLGPHSFIHPPVALLLFLPFLVLPTILWWAIPLIGTAILVYRWRPAPWAWPLLALALAWPRSMGAILAGNSDIWAMFAVALGTRYGWPFALLVLKPTFLPFAILGGRRAVIGSAVAGLAMIPLIPLWLQYLTVVQGTDLAPSYSLLSLPIILIPVIAWVARG